MSLRKGKPPDFQGLLSTGTDVELSLGDLKFHCDFIMREAVGKKKSQVMNGAWALFSESYGSVITM